VNWFALGAHRKANPILNWGIAGMLSVGLAVLQIATVSPQFHKVLHGSTVCHPDAHQPQKDPVKPGEDDHLCAVTLLSQGVVAESPAILMGYILGCFASKVKEDSHSLPSREEPACLARGPPAEKFV
jgi:hypothetical protein